MSKAVCKTPTLGRVLARRKTGRENFHSNEANTQTSLLDYWQWSQSDLVDNTARGVLAEFIVAKALGISTDGVRDAWGKCDLMTADGTQVQVKSAAFLQGWNQEKPTSISFSIAAKRAWDPETNRLDDVPARHADVYVFALLAHQEKSTLDPLNLAQWQFFVVRTSVLNERMANKQSITLNSLKALAGQSASFAELAGVFAKCMTAN